MVLSIQQGLNKYLWTKWQLKEPSYQGTKGPWGLCWVNTGEKVEAEAGVHGELEVADWRPKSGLLVGTPGS